MTRDNEQVAETKGEAARPAEAPAFWAAAAIFGRDATIRALRERLAAAEAEADALREQCLRKAADLDNYRKRAQRDQRDAVQRSERAVFAAFLPVLDNLERAIAHGGEEADEAALRGVVEGVRMVHRQLLDVFERHGVKPVAAVGEVFDPAVHEAIQQEPSDAPRQTILRELQRGYTAAGGLVRPALVVVSSGPEERTPPSAGADEAALAASGTAGEERDEDGEARAAPREPAEARAAEGAPQEGSA